MDKKKLTPKQIFRTLAFHYHYSENIPVELICNMVSSLYYPKDPNGQSQKRYKALLMMMIKQFTNGEKTINEKQFINFMTQISKLKNDQYSQKLTNRMFARYSQIDPDSKESVICETGFRQISKFIKIPEDQIMDYFHSVSDRKNQINMEMFNEYMNSILVTYAKEPQTKIDQ